MYCRNPNGNSKINTDQEVDNNYYQNKMPCCDNDFMPYDLYSTSHDDPPIGMYSQARPHIMPYPHYPNVHVI